MKNGKCPAGEYYCYTNKECKPIPAGFMVDPEGMLRKENGASTTSEGWSAKYKKSIDCDNPKGFSQRAHCQGRKKKMKESKDHEVAMAQSQLKNIEKNVKSLKKKLGTKEKDIPAWMQDKISKTHHNMAAVGEYHEEQVVNEEGLRDWFGKSKSKDGKKGWVNVVTGDSCASDKPGEGIPKCVSSAKRASMSKKERLAAAAAKRREDPGQQSKSGAAKPTNVKTDRKVRKEEMELCPVCGFDPCQCLEGTVTEAKDKKGKGSGKKDACYNKVKSRYDVWPSAYASGALVKCRKVGAANWGNKSESLSPMSQKIIAEFFGPFKSKEQKEKEAREAEVKAALNRFSGGYDSNAGTTTPGGSNAKPSVFAPYRGQMGLITPGDTTGTPTTPPKSWSRIDSTNPGWKRHLDRYNVVRGKDQLSTDAASIPKPKPKPVVPVAAKPKPVVPVAAKPKPKVNPFPTRDSIKPKTPNPLMSANPPKSTMTYKTPNPLMSANPPKSKMTYKTPNPLMDKTFGYQTGNAPDQRLSRLQNSYEPEGEVVDEKCWVGYTQKGMKKKGNRVVPNCVKTEQYDSRNRKDGGNPDNSLRRAVRGMGEDPSNVLPSKLVKSVKEEMTRINENGQTYAVILTWRGKTYTFQMFIPTMRRPSKQEVEAQVRKVYPDARVLQFMPKQYDPADPTIMIPESYVKEQSVPVTAYNKGDRFKGRAGAIPKDELERNYEGSANRIRKTIKLANSHEFEGEMVEGAAWTKKSGKNPEGGLNEKGRKSYERENPGSDLKAPSKKVGNKRRASFCARMKGMKKKLTSAKTANDPDSRINKSLRAWNC